MKTVSAMEMRRHFGALLDRVRLRSERLVIERDGKPVAMITPAAEGRAGEDGRVRRRRALDTLCGLGGVTPRGADAGAWVARERNGWREGRR